MINRFLLTCMGAFFVISAQAQDNAGLFPELEGLGVKSQPQKVETAEQPVARPIKNDVDLDLANTIEQEDQSFVEIPSNPTPSANTAPVEASVKRNTPDKKLNGFFEIYPHNFQIVRPAVRGMQFCMGQISLTNGVNAQFNGAKLNIQYAKATIPYTFGPVGPGETTTGTLALGGEACEALLQQPNFEVLECYADKMSKEECTAKIKYVLK